MNPALIIAICVAGVAVAVLITSYVCYRMAFYNNPRKHNPDPYRHIKDDGSESSRFSKGLIDNILKEPCEDVFITARDGVRLRGRLYLSDEAAPFVIQAHGYRSTPMLDFSGGGALALELGFNIIMIDQRAHGKSGGRSISFGVKESLDVLSWVDFVKDTWGEDREIILEGVSMGAATVILAAGHPLSPSVKGIIADCPYSGGKEIIKKVISEMKLPASLLYPFVRLGGMIFGGFDINSSDVLSAAAKSEVPILLIHGEADGFVPCDMSRKIAEQSNLVTLHTFPDAHHGTSFIQDNERYRKIADDFCKLYLKNIK